MRTLQVMTHILGYCSQPQLDDHLWNSMDSQEIPPLEGVTGACVYFTFSTREPRSAAESTCGKVVLLLVESLPKIGTAARG